MGYTLLLTRKKRYLGPGVVEYSFDSGIDNKTTQKYNRIQLNHTQQLELQKSLLIYICL